MKNSNEMVNSLFERRDIYIAEQNAKRKSTLKIAVSVCSLCLVALAGFGVWKSGTGAAKSAIQPSGTPSTAQIDNGKNDIPTTNTPQNETPSVDGDGIGYGVGGFMIPALPQNNNITFTGEKITDDEAKAYFSENYVSIVGAFLANGVSADNIKISEHGYCHISYDGTEGKGLEVRQNFRDYLVYNGDSLIAIMTLTKENGEISNTPSFGAPWFDSYNKYLQNHAGQELIYVYAANTEIVIAPDGSYVNPIGYDVSDYLNPVKNPYEWFYNENAVFVP